jgi:hypothetical protein
MMSNPRYNKAKRRRVRLKLLETVIVQTKESIIITEADFGNRKLPKIVYVNQHSPLEVAQ